MTPYWIVFLAPLLGVLMPFRTARDLGNVVWIAIGIALVLFVGLRHEVGMDWPAYLALYNVAVGDTDPIWITELGHHFVSRLSGWMDWGIYGVNTICGALFVTGLITFVRRQPVPWLALAAAVPYLLIIVAMNNTRQSAALGIFFLALLALERGQVRKFGALVVGAAMFHASAIACILFAALKVRRVELRSLVIAVAVMLALAVGYLAEHYERYMNSYIGTEIQSSGAAIRLVINIVAFAVMLALRGPWKERFGIDRLWFWMGMLSVMLLPIVPFASTAIDRMSLYLMPLQIYVWGRAPALIKTPVWRTAMVMAVVGCYAMVLWVWLAYANNSSAWMPYQNVLMGLPD